MRVQEIDLCFNDIVKQGYVYFHSKHLWIYRRFWLILRTASTKGPRRLEQFSKEQAANCQCKHKVKLRTVSRPLQEKKKNTIILTSKDDSQKDFACDSGESLKLKDLNLTELNNGPVVLYTNCHPNPFKQFHVFLKPSTSMEFYRECILQFSCDALWLWDSRNPCRKITSWPLKALRRYGRSQTWFTFEAGSLTDLVLCCDDYVFLKMFGAVYERDPETLPPSLGPRSFKLD
uniref:IRS-type PTB domain-containing protein n=1 Tax=Esox lucius TaxID=8010 RepID=A0A3P8YF28_ESOLU